MKKNIVRIACLLMVFAMVFAFASCGADNSDSNILKVMFVDGDGNAIDLSGISVGGGSAGGNSSAPAQSSTPSQSSTPAAPTEVPQNNAPANTPAETPADKPAETPADTPAETPADTPAAPADTPAAPAASGLPSAPADILAKYTEVLNAARAAKPAFKKTEYQALPKEYQNMGKLGSVLLPIAEGFMTTQDKMEVQDTEAGSGMGRFPLYKDNAPGCLLTDTSAIKSASCKDNGDGTATIVIVLNDEQNPEPISGDNPTSAPSYHGAMFAPMSKADIDNTIAGIGAVTVNSFSLTYTDCTATLTYKTDGSNQVVKLQQIMNVDITANVTGLKIVTIDGSARLVNTMDIYDVVY